MIVVSDTTAITSLLKINRRNQMIFSLADILQSLEQDANFYLDESLKRSLLVRANEAA